MRESIQMRCVLLIVLMSIIAGCDSKTPQRPRVKDLINDLAASGDQKSVVQSPERDPRYPARWWTPVSKEGAPSWEILPQEAGPGEVILSKRQPDLGLLSNFAATPFEFHGRRYASLEGFWQSLLYPEGPDDPRAHSRV